MATTTSAQQIMRKSRMDSPDGVPPEYWELLNKYRDELIAQATAILGSAHDAEDVVQETFCEALRNTDKMTHADSLGAWMRNVNRCNALNRLRSRTRDKKKSERMIQLVPEAAHTTGGFSALELRDSVAKALQTLPADVREIVNLRYWENLSYKEISVRLNLPVGTVGRILCEASLQLYEAMKAQLETGGPAPDLPPNAQQA